MSKRRVAITGVGLVTPIGLDPESTWDALLRGVSGVGPITLFDASDQSVRIAAEVEGFEPDRYMDPKDARRADRFLQFAMGAASQCIEQAGFGEGFGDVGSSRIGTIVGCGIGGLPLLEEQHKKLLDRGPGRVSPFFLPYFIADMAAGMI